MLCAVGSQAGEEVSSAFLKFSKTMNISRKRIYTKLQKEHLFSYALFSGNNNEKQHEKNTPMLGPWLGGESPPKISFAPPWNMCWT